MTSPKPHFLLFCDGNVPAHGGESAGSSRGRWRFVLEDLASGERSEATDQEVGCAPDRTALVAVLRGLEALEQPSRVTLVTTSRYVTRGLQYGLSEWRESDYTWEHFGAVQPIRNADIWKRIDRALAFHQVQCRWMAQDGGSEGPEEAPPGDGSIAIHAAAASSEVVVAARKPSTAHETHRSSKKPEGSRNSVSTSKYQRVYVDTPSVPVAARESGPNAACLAARGLNRGEDPLQSQEKFGHSVLSAKKFEWSAKRLGQCCLWPFQIVFRGPLWLCRHSWEAILAVDEWLESFLRCLLLLDPYKKPTRH